jgi:hypothetical protein
VNSKFCEVCEVELTKKPKESHAAWKDDVFAHIDVREKLGCQ